MRSFLAILVLAFNISTKAKSNPNIVIIFTDDQGYADVGCFGAEEYKTPNLDKMASEGIRFTDFYVAQAVCGASRAALLTGCYPNRINMLGAPGEEEPFFGKPVNLTVSADQTITGAKTLSNAVVKMTNLPTSDPGVAGQLWRDGTDLKVSVG